MIVGEIRRYLRDNSTMRVSRAMRDTAYKVLQAKEAYMAEHQREPTVDEIARMLELKREDVVFALDAILEPVSLYEGGDLPGPGVPPGEERPAPDQKGPVNSRLRAALHICRLSPGLRPGSS